VFSLPPGVTVTDRLTADDAVAIALWNNAALEADLAYIGIAQADLLDAGLLKNPTFQTLLPVGVKPFEFLLNWPIEDLWQRKKRVLAARQNLDAVATGLVQNGLNLVRDVRLAHADIWLAEKRATTLDESANLRARIATLTERRRDAGDASGLDVTLTAADARSAAELAKRAIGDMEIARTRLRRLMGLRDDPRPLSAVANSKWPDIGPADELVRSSYSSRPDLRAAELAIEANVYRAKWQRSRVFNLVMPLLSMKEVGSPLSTRSGPGLQMELPIFNRNQGQIARADGEVIQAAWRYRALRDVVEADVRDAAARLQQSRSSLEQLRTELKPIVEQAISQTESAYQNGDLSYLNVLEVTRQRFDAALRELDAEAALARAYAELERAIGRRL
jgi:cobalt-zinc-cadmium efflux system outer membrane protein